MLADRVQTLLHFEIVTLNAQVVPSVQRLEHFMRFNGLCSHILVDLGHFTLENELDVLEFGEEKLQVTNPLLVLEGLSLIVTNLVEKR